MCAVCVCVNFQIHCLKRNLSGFVAFFNRSLCEVVCSRIRLVAFDCCFALGRLDGLLIHSFINFIIIIIWWLAEGITMVLLLRNGIRLMVFFPTSKRDWFVYGCENVYVISTCMISLSSNHFQHIAAWTNGLLRFMINLMWVNFHDKFISSQRRWWQLCRNQFATRESSLEVRNDAPSRARGLTPRLNR